MGIFGVYALICTFLLLVYYMVTIWFDLHGNKGSKKEETETISTGDMVDTEVSTDVRELDGGGYQLSSGEDEFYEEQVQEEQVKVEPSGESVEGSDEGTAEELPGPSVDDKDGDGDSSDGPSVYERAKKVHDEGCQPTPKQYEMQLEGVAMMAKMSAPIIQKNEVHRRRLYC